MANPIPTAKDARETVAPMADRAKDLASSLADKAKDTAASAADKARDMTSNLGRKADEMAGKVGTGMESAASSLREHAPQGGTLGSAAAKVADTLESSGRYLEQEGLSGLADDVTKMIKRNPIPSLMVAVGIGFLLARATRS